MKTVKGKSMPVNYDYEIINEKEFDPSRMSSHFDTCPKADEHRKPKKFKEDELWS